MYDDIIIIITMSVCDPNKFWYVRDPNESFKTFLTLLEIIEVTKSFLYMELGDY